MARTYTSATFGEFAVAAVGELITPSAVEERIRDAMSSVTGTFAGARIVDLRIGQVSLAEMNADELAFLVPVRAGFRAGPLPVKVGATVEFDLILRVRAHRPGVLRFGADPIGDLELEVSGSGLLPWVNGGSSRRATSASLDGLIGKLLGRQRVDLVAELTGTKSDEGPRIPFAELGPQVLQACADPAVVLRALGPEADSPDLELLEIERIGREPRPSDSQLKLLATARVRLHFPLQGTRFDVAALVQTVAVVTTSAAPATVHVRFEDHRVRLDGPPRRTEGPRRPVPAWYLGKAVRRRLLARLPELLTPREFRVTELVSRRPEPESFPLDHRIVISEKCRASGEQLHAMTLGKGQSVTVRARLERSAGSIGSPRAEVAICDGLGDPAMTERAGFDDGNRATIGFAFTAPHAGRWAVRVRDTGEGDAGIAFAYRLQVKPE